MAAVRVVSHCWLGASPRHASGVVAGEPDDCPLDGWPVGPVGGLGFVFGPPCFVRGPPVVVLVDCDGASPLRGGAPSESFAAEATGYEQLVDWLRSKGGPIRVGVEGTGSYGAGLARYLAEAGVEVVEVNRPNRQLRRQKGGKTVQRRRRRGAARAAASGQATSVPKSGDGPVECPRMLLVARRSATKARTQAANQIHSLVVGAPEPLKHQLGGLKLEVRVRVWSRWCPSQAQTTIAYAKRALRHLTRRYLTLNGGDHPPQPPGGRSRPTRTPRPARTLPLRLEPISPSDCLAPITKSRPAAGDRLPVSAATAAVLAAVHSATTGPDEIIAFAFGQLDHPDEYRLAYQAMLDAAVEQGLVETRNGGVWLQGEWAADWTRAFDYVRKRDTSRLRRPLQAETPQTQVCCVGAAPYAGVSV